MLITEHGETKLLKQREQRTNRKYEEVRRMLRCSREEPPIVAVSDK